MRIIVLSGQEVVDEKVELSDLVEGDWVANMFANFVRENPDIPNPILVARAEEHTLFGHVTRKGSHFVANFALSCPEGRPISYKSEIIEYAAQVQGSSG